VSGVLEPGLQLQLGLTRVDCNQFRQYWEPLGKVAFHMGTGMWGTLCLVGILKYNVASVFCILVARGSLG